MEELRRPIHDLQKWLLFSLCITVVSILGISVFFADEICKLHSQVLDLRAEVNKLKQAQDENASGFANLNLAVYDLTVANEKLKKRVSSPDLFREDENPYDCAVAGSCDLPESNWESPAEQERVREEDMQRGW